MLKRVAIALLVAFLGMVPLTADAGSSSVGDCCASALNIGVGISDLASSTQILLEGVIPAAQLGQLQKSLAKAQENIAIGVEEGEGTCDGRKSDQRYRLAQGWLQNFIEVLETAGQNGLLISWAEGLIADINSLIEGFCDSAPA